MVARVATWRPRRVNHDLKIGRSMSASASRNKVRRFLARHWHRVSKRIQNMAAALYPIMSEGMSPYEIYYVLATDEEIQRLNELSATMAVH